ncbi:MAG TPA: hypothetical protein VMN39_06710 [Longimicrobiaceae bacterium]|nr:hypothetical protein [Longimicrobiaceae bacterium]
MLLLAVAACGEAEEDAPAATLPEYEGVSRDQLEAQIEAMTPEEAERLGVIDTTMGVGPPMDPDSVVPLGAPTIVPIDTGAR